MVGSAIFLMVARSLDFIRKYEVPRLKFDGENDVERCEIRFDLGQKNQEYRKMNAQNSLEVSPPNVEEINELHEIFKFSKKV